ncbi:hypothetical protein QM565_18675 [Geitlerinema splendidum]|nr:hypothetical protein [Geitlerinema splendidum]
MARSASRDGEAAGCRATGQPAFDGIREARTGLARPAPRAARDIEGRHEVLATTALRQTPRCRAACA